MIYSPLVQKAASIAFEVHKNKKDKGGYPYILHPFFLAREMDTEETVIIALLHDTVEDGNIDFEYLEKEGFPERIVSAVRILTKDKNADYFQYISEIKQNPDAVKVKIADLKHNMDLSRLSEITQKDIDRAEKYKKALKILTDD